jgi:hypothetical protein
MMTGPRILAIAAAFGALVAAGGASAQTAAMHAPLNLGFEAGSASFSPVAEQSQWNAPPSEKSLFWDQKGHWGLKLDMAQPVGREMQLRDVQAGAYFHITPSIRVGGAVALGDSAAQDRTAPPQQQSQTPRVKLETSFKF